VIDPQYFERKRQELGFDRVDQLATVQKWLDERYPGQARAKLLHQGVLRVVTISAPVASELRMRQFEIIENAGLAGVRLAITIGALR